MKKLKEKDRKAIAKGYDRKKGRDVNMDDYPEGAKAEIMPHDMVKVAWVVDGKKEWSIDPQESMWTIRWDFNEKTLARMEKAKANE